MSPGYVRTKSVGESEGACKAKGDGGTGLLLK
jgi:hypothetical protein